MTESAEEAEEIRTQWLTFDCVAEVRVLDESRDGPPSKTRLPPASLTNFRPFLCPDFAFFANKGDNQG